MGYEDVANDEAALRALVDGAKAVADKKKTVSDEDLETLLGETLTLTLTLTLALTLALTLTSLETLRSTTRPYPECYP